MGIGQNIKNKRHELHIAQNNLALVLNVQPQTIGKWERDESTPDILMISAIANVFKCSIDSLIGYSCPNSELKNEQHIDLRLNSIFEFSDNLRKRRMAMDFSQTFVAEKINVRSQTVSKWENGTCLPNIDYIKDLCALYSITSNELVYGINLPTKESKLEEIKKPETNSKILSTNRFKKLFFSFVSLSASIIIAFIILIPLFSSYANSNNQNNNIDNSNGSNNLENENQINIYNLELKDTIYGRNISIKYNENATVEKPNDLAETEDYRFHHWCYNAHTFNRVDNLKCVKVDFPFKIKKHMTIYAEYEYLWGDDPRQYNDAQDSADNISLDALILKEFIKGAYEWMNDSWKMYNEFKLNPSAQELNRKYNLFEENHRINLSDYSDKTGEVPFPKVLTLYLEKVGLLKNEYDKFLCRFKDVLNYVISVSEIMWLEPTSLLSSCKCGEKNASIHYNVTEVYRPLELEHCIKYCEIFNKFEVKCPYKT